MTSQNPTILHVIDTTGPGGAETVFLDLAEGLKIEGWHTLALIKGSGWVQDQLTARSIPFLVLKPSGFLSLPYYWQVIRLTRQHNVKFVQAHLLGSALTFAIVSLLTRLPVVATLHGQVDVNAKERFMGVKQWLLKHGLKRVVAVSDQLRQYLNQRGLFGTQQVEVIHNGIDVSRYGQEAQSDIRTTLGLPANTKLVGCLGNVRTAKDYGMLVNAAKELTSRWPEVHFVIAGHSKEPLQSELNQLAALLDVYNNVHFMGFLDNTADFLTQIDAFALSSSSEGFSIATLEAMASKKPVVVTKCGGPEEIITPNVDGLMVEVGDSVALAASLEQVLVNNDDVMIQSAFEKVTNKFDRRSLIEKYKSLFDQVV